MGFTPVSLREYERLLVKVADGTLEIFPMDEAVEAAA